MTSPLVSVIIPTYNRAETVRRSIDSALDQTYRPLEVIVVDDGSSDNTREVLEGYGDRIRAIYQENGGPSVARNTGVSAARGEFIAFLDSDDTWKPSKTEAQVRLMLAGGAQVPCCISNASLIAGDGSVTTSFGVSDVLSGLTEGYWTNPAPIIATRFILFNQVIMIRREAFGKIGGFKPRMRLLEDYDLAFRLALLGPWAFASDPLVEKYNDTDGIGVVAMLDPVVHARAWQGVLEGFLREPIPDSHVKSLLQSALADVKTEIRSVQALQGSSAAGRLAARISMFLMRKRQSVRRRLPGWPRVNAVSSLHPASVGAAVPVLPTSGIDLPPSSIAS